MSDQSTAAGAAAEATTERVIEKPLEMWVKGGTSTTANDERLEREYQESERNRRIADAERALASRPIEQGGALMYERDLYGGPLGATYIHVRYCNRSGHEYCQGVADITMGTPSDPLEMMVVFVCPRCAATKPHMQDCQIQMRQSNKKFEFRPHEGRFFMFDDGNGMMRYREAGVVVESESFKCPHCTYRARFDNNRLIED